MPPEEVKFYLPMIDSIAIGDTPYTLIMKFIILKLVEMNLKTNAARVLPATSQYAAKLNAMSDREGATSNFSKGITACWCSENGQRPYRLPSGDVHLWMVRFDDMRFDPTWIHELDTHEESRARSFATQELQNRFIASHHYLRKVLGGYMHCAAGDITFSVLPAGKPVVDGSPLQFSISHTDKRVIVAVSMNTPLGVDIEEINPIPEWRMLAERWFSGSELEWIDSRPNTNEAFLKCWVRREAFVKALGTGLSLSLDAFSISPPPLPSNVQDIRGLFTIDDISTNDTSIKHQWVGAIAQRQRSGE